jgi:hypothetical protein
LRLEEWLGEDGEELVGFCSWRMRCGTKATGCDCSFADSEA